MKKLNFAKKALALFAVFASVLTMAFAMSFEYRIEVANVGETFNITLNYVEGSETITITGNGTFDFTAGYATPVSASVNGTTINCGSTGTATLASGQVIGIDVPLSHKWDKNGGGKFVIVGNK